MTQMLEELAQLVIQGQDQQTKKKVQEALSAGIPAGDILNKGLIAGMNVVGEKFGQGEFFVPEVMLAARAMHAALEDLRPILTKEGSNQQIGCVVIGTVAGDLHDIGKNLVAMMLEGAGFKVHDLGVNVTSEKFIKAVKEYKADIMAMSTLVTTCMPQMKKTIEHLAKEGLSGKVFSLVGGAPVTKEFSKKIAADGYGANATEAVLVAKQLLTGG